MVPVEPSCPACSTQLDGSLGTPARLALPLPPRSAGGDHHEVSHGLAPHVRQDRRCSALRLHILGSVQLGVVTSKSSPHVRHRVVSHRTRYQRKSAQASSSNPGETTTSAPIQHDITPPLPHSPSAYVAQSVVLFLCGPLHGVAASRVIPVGHCTLRLSQGNTLRVINVVPTGPLTHTQHPVQHGYCETSIFHICPAYPPSDPPILLLTCRSGWIPLLQFLLCVIL